jgi:DNA-binding HxlR family transcriptional regulator
MSEMCPKFERASELIGKRWVHLIVFALMECPKRFNQIQDELHITAKMLSERLKVLEEENVIRRNVYPETPVRIEYELTNKGHELKPIIESLSRWSKAWY